MVIFSINKKNCLHEDALFKKNHSLNEKISHTPPQKNDGPSLTLFPLKNNSVSVHASSDQIFCLFVSFRPVERAEVINETLTINSVTKRIIHP